MGAAGRWPAGGEALGCALLGGCRPRVHHGDWDTARPAHVTRLWQAVVAQLRLGRPVRFHDLRHISASLQLAQGVEPRVVMETLGHSVIGTTFNLYGYVLPVVQRAAARINEALGSA